VGGTGGGGGAPSVDPCEYASLGDGHYCGSALAHGADPSTLFDCQGGATATSELCAFGCTAKGPGAPDSCAPDPSTIPVGKGVWIWTFGSSAPPASEVAATAKSLGVGFVLIKSGEDLSTYGSNFNASIVDSFTSQGIWVFAWNYVRPGDVQAKADAIAAQANIAGVKGMVLDVEVEWEGTSSEADAVALCDDIRALAPGKLLGFSSFGWIAYHPGFPWVEFDQHCSDMHLPQTYWDAWTGVSPTAGYMKAIDGAQGLGLTAPIWAAQDNYEGTPTSAELNEFFAAAGPFSSLWRWPNPGDTALAQQMTELDWANP